MGILEYYNVEIAQNSRDQEKYLLEFAQLQTDEIDNVWKTLYGLIFYSKTLEKLNSKYYQLASQLNHFEQSLGFDSNLLPKIYFEKGLRFELENELNHSKENFRKALRTAGKYPFLHDVRFFSLLHLSKIAQKEKKLTDALKLVNDAKMHINKADTLRSNYFLNRYASLYYNELKKYDSAYALLNKAYKADFNLDFRRNTLEINRLNVVLQTQQKELENNKLKQNRIWFYVALSILGLLLVLSYFAYKNIGNKKKIVEKEKEVQAQKMEKLLKEQELLGIDAMIEGQEKERRRIANDLHDNLGSILATLKMRFQHLKMNGNAGANEQKLQLENTDELLEEAYQKVRSMAHASNAGVHAQEGLLPGVKNFAAKVSLSNRLAISVIDQRMNERLENSLEITLFRIIQELITNIIKHAQATEATIHLTHHEDSINILVEDNGKGFEVKELRPMAGMGLYSIQKRIENLKGQLTIESIIQKGTTVIIDIPIP